MYYRLCLLVCLFTCFITVFMLTHHRGRALSTLAAGGGLCAGAFGSNAHQWQDRYDESESRESCRGSAAGDCPGDADQRVR